MVVGKRLLSGEKGAAEPAMKEKHGSAVSKDQQQRKQQQLQYKQKQQPQNLLQVQQPQKQNLFVDDQFDSSDEDRPDTLGDIPLSWYADYDHVGYDLHGAKIAKPPQGISTSHIDEFLSRSDDPDYWRKVRDTLTGKDVVLSKEDMRLISSVMKGRFPSLSSSFDPYEVFPESIHQDSIHPVSAVLPPKSSFGPSKTEARKIAHLVRSIQKGWIKLDVVSRSPEFYNLWETPGVKSSNDIPPLRRKLPSHSESYNPPSEYLPSEDEIASWNNSDPSEREYNYIPQQFNHLRQVPAYPDSLKEAFERCLDLYLCPRVQRVKQRIDPESLLPQLPKPQELRPFPTTATITFSGHKGPVRQIDIHPQFVEWLVSGGDDKTLRLWEIDSGRCVHHWGPYPSVVGCVRWNPSEQLHLLTFSVNDILYFLIPNIPHTDDSFVTNTRKMLLDYDLHDAGSTDSFKWEDCEPDFGNQGIVLRIRHSSGQGEIQHLVWHHKGDYLAVLFNIEMASGSSKTSVVVHQISKHRSQSPFRSMKAPVQCILFHPRKPFLFVSTQSFVRIYHLGQNQVLRKLHTGFTLISSMSVHPSGDHLVVGSYDNKVCWFDLDLSVRPYKVLRHHKMPVRAVDCHPFYPLFATAADDASIHVFHGMVYSDYLKNPLIVPLKVLHGHTAVNDKGVFDIKFHPIQPWIFSAGADGKILMFTNWN